MRYAFFVGRTKALSIAELGSFFGEKLEWKPEREVAFFEGDLPSPPQIFLNRLGGTTEIAQCLAQDISVKDIEPCIVKYLTKTCGQGACMFGISQVPETRDSKMLRYLLPKIKKALRAAGTPAKFANSGIHNVSQVFAKKNGMVEAGTMLWLIDEGEGRVSIFHTSAIQDFEAYSKRDYSKPFRDAKVGMLPPKLAQIMIHLALDSHQLPTTQDPLILDPFCGTGTILMEVLLMGFSAAGSDSDLRLCEGARKNVAWLQKQYPRISQAPTHIIKKSVLDIKKSDLPIDFASAKVSIVTEPFLGQPLSQIPSPELVRSMTHELSALYCGFFKSARLWLSSGSVVVIVFPCWKVSANSHHSLANELVKKIVALGYTVAQFMPLKKTSLVYSREKQIVSREIVRFIAS